MSLASLIRGKGTSHRFATATVATVATADGERERTVASVTTVAVASSPKAISTEPNTAEAWLLHFTDAEPLEVWFAPAATHTAVLAAYPDAVAAEPVPKRTGRKATASEADELRALVQTIYAADIELDRQEALDAAVADPDAALPCYRAIAVERGNVPTMVGEDDRRTCGQCANLRGRVCRIAEPGGLVSARRGYEPIRDLPRRCEGYAPGTDDPDRRPGRKRWPGLAPLANEIRLSGKCAS